jgi:methionyl-tRNA formyltransferase
MGVETSIVFTNSLKFIKLVNQFFTIKKVLVDSSKEELEILNYCNWNSIDIIFYKNKTDLSFLKPYKESYAFTYGFNHIFTNKIINIFEKGIWNIHPGDLPNYRGRHPVQWAMINGEKRVGVSIHSITPEIDKGNLLALDYIEVEVEDTESMIYSKIFQLLERKLINLSLINYDKNEYVKLGKGTYYPSLKGGPQISHYSKYTSIEFFNLIKSQQEYNGLEVNGKKYTKASYYEKDCLGNYPQEQIFTFKDNKQLILHL